MNYQQTMESRPQEQSIPKWKLWVGYIMSALPVLMLLLSATMKFLKPAAVIEGFAHLGYAENTALGLGILELVCTLMYLIPRTSFIGAILLTGYLGGATATHLRIGEPSLAPVILGILVWGGLYLRQPELQSLVRGR